MKFCADIHSAQRMNPDDLCDPLTFILQLLHKVGICGFGKYLHHYFNSPNTVFYD